MQWLTAGLEKAIRVQNEDRGHSTLPQKELKNESLYNQISQDIVAQRQ